MPILRQKKPVPIPNRMVDLAKQMPEEPGRCAMEPGAQNYDDASSGEAHVNSPGTCPRCKQATLRHVHYDPTISATAPVISIDMPTWANKADAGPWAQGEWDRYYGDLLKHEHKHSALYIAHCAEARALIEAFAKCRFIGEVCNVDKKAGEARASELALAEFDKAKKKLDDELAALETKITAAQKKFDADTKHGKTEGCVMDGDIPLLGAKP